MTHNDETHNSMSLDILERYWKYLGSENYIERQVIPSEKKGDYSSPFSGYWRNEGVQIPSYEVTKIASQVTHSREGSPNIWEPQLDPWSYGNVKIQKRMGKKKNTDDPTCLHTSTQDPTCLHTSTQDPTCLHISTQEQRGRNKGSKNRRSKGKEQPKNSFTSAKGHTESGSSTSRSSTSGSSTSRSRSPLLGIKNIAKKLRRSKSGSHKSSNSSQKTNARKTVNNEQLVHDLHQSASIPRYGFYGDRVWTLPDSKEGGSSNNKAEEILHARTKSFPDLIREEMLYKSAVPHDPFCSIEDRQSSLNRKKLIVLDLDGLLWNRKGRRVSIDPEAKSFISKCFKCADVGFYSSSTSKNVLAPLKALLTDKQQSQMSFFWDRSMCVLNPTIEVPYGTLKPVNRIRRLIPKYRNADIVIVDDSPSKMTSNRAESVVIRKSSTRLRDVFPVISERFDLLQKLDPIQG